MLTLFGVFFIAGLSPSPTPHLHYLMEQREKRNHSNSQRLNNSCCRLAQRMFSANHQACLVPDSQEQALGREQWHPHSAKELRGDPNHYVQKSSRNSEETVHSNRKKEHMESRLEVEPGKESSHRRNGVWKRHILSKIAQRIPESMGGSTWLRCRAILLYSIPFAH